MQNSFGKTLKHELHVIAHGQSAHFRLVKYLVLFGICFFLYQGYGWGGVVNFLLIGALLGIVVHFFFRYKTKGWTKSWGLYQLARSANTTNRLV